MSTIRPWDEMNAMDSGIQVSFIQKGAWSSEGKTKIIPASSGSEDLLDRPTALDAGVSATSSFTVTCRAEAVVMRAEAAAETMALGVPGFTGRVGGGGGVVAVGRGGVAVAIGGVGLDVAGAAATEGVAMAVEGGGAVLPTVGTPAVGTGSAAGAAPQPIATRTKIDIPMRRRILMLSVAFPLRREAPHCKSAYVRCRGAKLRASFFTPRCSKATVTSSSVRVIWLETTTPFPKAGWYTRSPGLKVVSVFPSPADC